MNVSSLLYTSELPCYIIRILITDGGSVGYVGPDNIFSYYSHVFGPELNQRPFIHVKFRFNRMTTANQKSTHLVR